MNNKKRQTIELKLTEEHLQDLFQGKRFCLDYQGEPLIMIYPPRYGVFMTHEKYQELEEAAYTKSFLKLMELLKENRK